MIVASRFPGDDNDVVMNLQHDCYGHSLWLIVNQCKYRYLEAVRLLSLSNDFIKTVRELESFDHRTLQYTHDILAAIFRERNAERLQQSLPGIIYDGSYKDWVLVEWGNFLQTEIKCILDNTPEFARWVLTAIIYPNPDLKGKSAEAALEGYMDLKLKSL